MPLSTFEPFTRIPPELQDIIYTHALVCPAIYIKPPISGWCHIENPRRNAYCAIVYYSADYSRMTSAPNLALFLVNRTVYARASAIFYQKNVFDFTAGQTADPESGMSVDNLTSLNICTQFLCDRPMRALSLIRHLRIPLGDFREYSLRPGFPLYRWTDLCAMLADGHLGMWLHTLSLCIKGRFDANGVVGSGPVPWLNCFPEIKSLQEVRVELETQSNLENGKDFLNIVRRGLMGGGRKQEGYEGIEAGIIESENGGHDYRWMKMTAVRAKAEPNTSSS